MSLPADSPRRQRSVAAPRTAPAAEYPWGPCQASDSDWKRGLYRLAKKYGSSEAIMRTGPGEVGVALAPSFAPAVSLPRSGDTAARLHPNTERRRAYGEEYAARIRVELARAGLPALWVQVSDEYRVVVVDRSAEVAAPRVFVTLADYRAQDGAGQRGPASKMQPAIWGPLEVFSLHGDPPDGIGARGFTDPSLYRFARARGIMFTRLRPGVFFRI